MPSNVVARGDSYGARINVGGKQVWLGTYPTRQLADGAVAHARGGALPSTIKVAEWADMWMELFPGRRNADTIRHNQQMISGFVRQYGHRRLDSITRLETAFHARRSPGSVRYLRLMWAKAVRCQIVPGNPWDTTEVTSHRRAQVIPDAALVDALGVAARARGWVGFADCIVFTAYSGLRLSEVADVTAADVLDDGRRLVVRGKRAAGEVEPRVRVVAVFEPGRGVLRANAPEVGLVWRSPQGRRLTRESVSRCFRAVADDVGFEGTFHALRKFHAGFLADHGADARDIAQQLGHVDRAGRPYPELVNRVYSHPSVEAALSRLEAVAG